MKTTQNKSIQSYIILLTYSFLIIFLLGSCTKKINFLISPVVPAAEGSVQIKSDKNKNYVIDLDLIRLAAPERLTPPKKLYIVWMLTQQNNPLNIGQINSGTRFLSKSLKASFKTVSAFKPVKIFITAEEEANIQYPSSTVVLTTNNF